MGNIFQIEHIQGQHILLTHAADGAVREHLPLLNSQLLDNLQNNQDKVFVLIDGKIIGEMPKFMILREAEWVRQACLNGVIIFGLANTRQALMARLVFSFLGVSLYIVDSREAAMQQLQKLTIPADATKPLEPIPSELTETLSTATEQTLASTTQILGTSDEMRANYIAYIQSTHPNCEYCQLPNGVVTTYVAEAIPSQNHAQSDMRNLCVICEHCYYYKGDQISAYDPDTGNYLPLFHPRLDLWNAHFEWLEHGLIVNGITPTGRATVEALQLNTPERIDLRQRGLFEGWHQAPADADPTRFPANGKVRLEIRNVITGDIKKIVIDPRKGLTFGRGDPNPSQSADFSLLQYGGYRMGVSRRHARLALSPESVLTMTDLGSSNGTSINDEPLIPHQPFAIKNGDKAQLGELAIYIYFQT